LPAALIWILITRLDSSEYFWKVYTSVGEVYLAISFALGFLIPYLFLNRWKGHPIAWLFGQGLLAWMVAFVVLAVLNFTPLCVGQDNGDGSNDLALCLVQTAMVSVVYSPLEFILLCLIAFPGGWCIHRLVQRMAI
jgi:uncharacterized membrane protein AbrB (regulator of aidB expression)